MLSHISLRCSMSRMARYETQELLSSIIFRRKKKPQSMEDTVTTTFFTLPTEPSKEKKDLREKKKERFLKQNKISGFKPIILGIVFVSEIYDRVVLLFFSIKWFLPQLPCWWRLERWTDNARRVSADKIMLNQNKKICLQVMGRTDKDWHMDK